MADPTIQTFCCHHVTAMTRMSSNNVDKAIKLLQEFNSDNYNTVCLVSASLGILGAIYQILPREQTSHQQGTMPTCRGRQIIVWLAVADLMASIGVFVRSILWLTYDRIMPGRDDSSSVLFCALSSAWIQYFYTCTWLWTLIYAVDVKRSLKGLPPSSKYYHTSCWIIPALLTLVGLTVLYVPDADCHSANSLSTVLLRILPNYCATYLPIATVMIVNPLLYHSSSKDVESVLTVTSGQITKKERTVVDALKIKFALINFVFYICWWPNLLNGFLLWTLWFNLPLRIIVILWYIMAVTNPLQALFNTLVYRRWQRGSERIKFPCLNKHPSKLRFNSLPSTPDEGTPLIDSGGQPTSPSTRRSINNSCSNM